MTIRRLQHVGQRGGEGGRVVGVYGQTEPAPPNLFADKAIIGSNHGFAGCRRPNQHVTGADMVTIRHQEQRRGIDPGSELWFRYKAVIDDD